MEKQKTLLVAARYVLFCAAVVGIVLLCICHASCQITSEGIKVLEAEESPEIKNVKVLSENSIEVEFTKEVDVKSATVSPLLSGEKASIDQIAGTPVATECFITEDGSTVIYTFSETTDIGERYQLVSEIVDKRGNSLTFAFPFLGYNNRVPIMILTEISGATGTGTVNKEKVSRCEYIVLRALTDGNIAGVQIYSPRYPILSEYHLPSIEVKAGEYIMIHLRTYEGQAYTEELDDDIAKDKNEGYRDYMRDLYLPNPENKKCASEEYDAILLWNKSTMELMDAVLYTTENAKEKLLKNSDAVNFALSKWVSNSQEDGDPFILGKKMTATDGSLQRNNSDLLLKLVQEEGLTQKDIVSSKNDWKTGATLYNTKPKEKRP